MLKSLLPTPVHQTDIYDEDDGKSEQVSHIPEYIRCQN